MELKSHWEKMKKIPICVFAFLLCLHPLLAVQIEGVNISQSAKINGETLQLNGAGLRSFSLAFIPIKIYVASLYTPQPLRSAHAIMDSQGPMQFDFTFLRAVGQSDVTKAWSSQFSQSIGYTYSGSAKDRDAFIAMFGSLQKMGVEQVRLIGTNTVVYDQGTRKGTIEGRNFQRSFLSLWFGSNPVSSDLKNALLGK